MGKHKRRKKNRRALTEADKILIAAMLQALIAFIKLMED